MWTIARVNSVYWKSAFYGVIKIDLYIIACSLVLIFCVHYWLHSVLSLADAHTIYCIHGCVWILNLRRQISNSRLLLFQIMLIVTCKYFWHLNWNFAIIKQDPACVLSIKTKLNNQGRNKWHTTKNRHFLCLYIRPSTYFFFTSQAS